MYKVAAWTAVYVQKEGSRRKPFLFITRKINRFDEGEVARKTTTQYVFRRKGWLMFAHAADVEVI